MKLNRKLLSTAALAATAFFANTALAQNITYTGNDNQAGYDISYSIETNGAIGLLSLNDIVNSSISFKATPSAVYNDKGPFSDTGTLYFSNTNPDALSPVSATSSNLFFDFGNRGGLNFCAGPLCYAFAALGINDEDAVVYDHNDPMTGAPIATRELDNPDATGFRLADGTYTAVLPTIQSFATASAAVASPTPEPATWGMMILGFGLAGVALRHRQKVTTRVSYAV